MKQLQEICDKYKVGDWPDKSSVHSYIEVYEDILAPYRETAKNVLEIGLMSGESLRMWTEYFTEAIVYGMDCDVRPIGGLADLGAVIQEGYNVIIGDASDPLTIDLRFGSIGVKLDVVIEDANHNIEQQLAIYKALKPYLNVGSIYIIEDPQALDKDKETYLSLAENVEIIDLRKVKNRYDDGLIIIRH